MRTPSRAVLAAALLCAPAAHGQVSNPSLATAPDQPERIQPGYQERGVTGYAGPNAAPAGSSSSPGTPADTSAGVTATDADPPGDGTSSAAVTKMLATSYGATAQQTAAQTGVSVDAVAAIGQVESGFKNVNTALGTSAATGPWQITPGTFRDTSAKYGLGYTGSDLTNPQAQAVEASYIIKDTAAAVSAATTKPATVLQTYAGYVMGPSNGAAIATASNDALLSSIVPTRFLTNNNIPLNTTVGQLNANYAARLGATANQRVLTSS